MANVQALNKKKINNERADLAAATVDMLDVGAIFVTFTSAFLRTFFEQIGKFIFFPVAAAMSLIRAGLSIREAALKKWKTRPVVIMMIEIASALAVTTAIAGSLILPAVFILAAPLIFASVLGFKTLFNAGACLYYASNAAATDDAHKKEKNKNLAITHGTTALSLGLVTAGVVSVFLFGKFVLAALAIAGGVAGALMATYRLYKTLRHKTEEEIQSSAPVEVNKATSRPEPKVTHTLWLTRIFRQEDPAPSEVSYLTAEQQLNQKITVRGAKNTIDLDHIVKEDYQQQPEPKSETRIYL